MSAAEGIHDNIAVKETEAHFVCPDFSFEYSFSHFSQDSGGGAGDSPASFNREATASFIRFFFSSLRYASSTASRIKVPSFLSCFAASSSRVLYCFSVKRTWTRWVYFMRKYYQNSSIMSIVEDSGEDSGNRERRCSH